jgi:hypothetical protein
MVPAIPLLVLFGAFVSSSIAATATSACQSKVVADLQKIRSEFDQRLLDVQLEAAKCDGENGYPTGWVWSPTVRKYYRVIFELVDWDTADSRCRELGSKSHLVVVNDAVENQAIRQLLASFDRRLTRICTAPRVIYPPSAFGGYWTSGQRADRTQCGATPWVWKPYPGVMLPVTFTDWNPGEPNCAHGQTEQCVHYGTETFLNYKWNDLNCNWPLCALCELDV